MKSSKIWRIIWISGIYLMLFVILYLVVLYKVKWEGKDLNTYLYFYDCNHELCSSTIKQDDYFSKYLCDNKECPYIDTIIGDRLILRNNNSSLIYDYINGNVIDNTYNDYRYIGNDLYVVCDKNNKYGIINNTGNLIVDLKYEYIHDYYNGIISYKKNGLFGIVNISENKNISNVYDDIILINDKIFAAKKDNIYQMYDYNNTNNENSSNKYNFVYSDNGIIVVSYNKKIDILDDKLSSLLLMKIDTFYDYTTGQERDSLNIYSDDNFIYFKVFISENEYNEYRYDIYNKKLLID